MDDGTRVSAKIEGSSGRVKRFAPVEVHGDYVEGDKAGGDKVAGNTTTEFKTTVTELVNAINEVLT